MKIRICDENENKINALIKKIEGRATARTLDYEDILDLSEMAEKDLERYDCAKKDRSGTVAIRHDSVLSSYKWTAESTKAEITRGSKDWFLTHVSRETCASNSKSRSTWLKLSPSAEESIMNAAVRTCEQGF